MIDDDIPMPLPRLSGPGVARWPRGTVAWCQRCNAPILAHQLAMVRIPFVTGDGGLDHQWCPPVLRVIREKSPGRKSSGDDERATRTWRRRDRKISR